MQGSDFAEKLEKIEQDLIDMLTKGQMSNFKPFP